MLIVCDFRFALSFVRCRTFQLSKGSNKIPAATFADNFEDQLYSFEFDCFCDDNYFLILI